MNNEIDPSFNRRVYIILLSLPLFILTWIYSNYFYALIIGIGSAVLLYLIFVWIPADKLHKQFRKARLAESRKLIKEIRRELQSIRQKDLKIDLDEACSLAEGLVLAIEKETKHQGKIEESLLPLLQNMRKQIERWRVHESGAQPLVKADAEKLLGILMNYDILFLKYQKGGIRSDEFLTSLYHTETAMLELGIDVNNTGNGVLKQ